MRILYLTNNKTGWHVAQWLKSQQENIVGLVLHPLDKRVHGDEIIEAIGLPEDCIFDGSQLRSEAKLQAIKALEPDIGISVFFGYILKQEFLSLFPKGCINLHPSYLPYNRGAYPNVWSIVEQTPAGATLHYIDEGIDTGEVISQKEVAVDPTDTGESLYLKLEDACVSLFQETWPLIQAGSAPRTTQLEINTSSHKAADVQQIDHIDLDKNYKARDLINILRARTFPPHKGAFFVEGGRRIYLQMKLIEDKEKIS